MERGKISVWQAVLLFALCRIFSVLNYVPAFNARVESTAALYGSVLAFIIQALMIIPAAILAGRFQNDNVITLSYRKSKPLGLGISLYFLLLLGLVIVGSCVNFNFFITSAVFPDASEVIIIVLMLVSCALCAKAGLQGVARAAVLLFVLFAVGTLILWGASVKNVSLLNIKPILSEPIKSVFTYAVTVIAKNAELYAVFLIYPSINGKKGKTVWYMLIITAFFNFAANFLVEGVLGEFSASQIFPYFTFSSVLELPLLQRLDSIHMISWVFIAFIRITVYFYLAARLLSPLLPKKLRGFALPSIFVVSAAASLIVSGNMDFLKSGVAYGVIPSVAAVTAIPILLLCICKKEDNDEKGQNSNADTAAEYDVIKSQRLSSFGSAERTRAGSGDRNRFKGR